MSATRYTARFAGAEFIERGVANLISCPVYRNGALVAPTSGTVTVTKADRTVLVTAAVTVVASVATYTILAATIAAQLLGEGWRIEWALVMPDRADPHTFKRGAILGRSALYPCITDEDLYGRRAELRGLLEAGASYQDDIDEAFVEVCNDLKQGGSLAHLIMEPENLRFVLLYKALGNIYRRFTTSPEASSEANWPEMATYYDDRFKESWGKLSVKYDANDTGVAVAVRPVFPVTFLGVPGVEADGYHDGGPRWR